MSVQIDGNTGVSLIQDGIVTPVKTQVGALPSMIRLNTANGYGSTNTVIRRFTNVVTNQGTDITYADSATLGASFTINTNGVYAISYCDNFSAAAWMGLSLNSNQLSTAINLITPANIISSAITGAASWGTCAVTTMYLPSGSVIRAHANATTSGANIALFTITRVA